MVAAQEEEVLGILDLVREQQANGLERLLATVNVVAEEEVVRLRRETAVLKQPQQVKVLGGDGATHTCYAPQHVSEASLQSGAGPGVPVRPGPGASAGAAAGAGGSKRTRRKEAMRRRQQDHDAIMKRSGRRARWLCGRVAAGAERHTCPCKSPQILMGASSSSSTGWFMKISRAAVHKLRLRAGEGSRADSYSGAAACDSGAAALAAPSGQVASVRARTSQPR